MIGLFIYFELEGCYILIGLVWVIYRFLGIEEGLIYLIDLFGLSLGRFFRKIWWCFYKKR